MTIATTPIRLALTCALVPSILSTGCNAGEIDPSEIGPPDTDSAGPPLDDGGDESGSDTDGERQRVCAVYDGEAGITQGTTVRWHCSGVNRGNIKVQLPEVEVLDPELIDVIANQGIDLQHNFGPNYGASWDDPAVIACCENGYDYPNTPLPTEDDAEHGWACAVDCVDQTCRMVPDLIRDFAEERKVLLDIAPFGCVFGGGTPCYYDQLTSLANYIAAHQQACVEAFLGDRNPPYTYQVIGLGGELDLDAWVAANDPGANAAWPSIQGVVIDGTCGIDGPDFDGWLVPPGPPQPCTDSNDNNDEDPFESGHGGGLWGPDTFVVSSGQVSLDGPTYMGIEADGSAPMKGLSNTDCDAETCTWLSFDVRHGTFYLQDLHVVVPENLEYEAGGNTLLLDDFRIHVDHPEGAPLDPLTSQFTFEPGSVKAIASGKLYGVPVFAEVLNTSPLQGQIAEVQTGMYEVALEPITFGYTDGMGNDWSLQVDFGAMLPKQRAPVADFQTKVVDGLLYLDASTSSDGDGDALTFTWYVDGTEVGNGSHLRMPWDPQAMHIVVLQVVDSTGRGDWSLGLLEDGQ